MSEDKKTPKEKIAEIKARQKEQLKKKNQEKIQQVKEKVKEKKTEEKIAEVKKENKIKYKFTDRQIIVHGEGKRAKAYFVNYNPDEEHAILQLIGDAPAGSATKGRRFQMALNAALEKVIKKLKNLVEDK